MSTENPETYTLATVSPMARAVVIAAAKNDILICWQKIFKYSNGKGYLTPEEKEHFLGNLRISRRIVENNGDKTSR